MTIAEIIDIEKGNFDKVNLVRGPLFWKAYEVSETNVVKTFSTDVPVSQSDFNKWKSDCVIDYDDNIDRPVECVNNNCDDNLRDRLSSLNLATMTPFDALAFLVDLQKELTFQK